MVPDLQDSRGPAELQAFLREKEIFPTSQRIVIAHVLFRERTHRTAEDIYRIVNRMDRHVSKATVYNTLGLFVQRGIVREVIADPGRVVYDPNTMPHHHFYDEGSGELTDIDAASVEISGLPPLPEGTELQGIDIVVRIRRAGGR